MIPTEKEMIFFQNIFTRKKRDDTPRMILNLKQFSYFQLVPHCLIESIEDVLITEYCILHQ